MSSNAPSTHRLLELLSLTRRTAMMADVLQRLARDVEDVRSLLEDLQKDVARVRSAIQHASPTGLVSDIQVKVTQLRPHFLILLADHREAQLFDVLPNPHPPVGTVVVDALDLDLHLGANLLATVAESRVSTDGWESMIKTISLFESAVQRALTYVDSTGAVIDAD